MAYNESTAREILTNAHVPDVPVRPDGREGRVTSPRPPRTTGPGSDRPFNVATADGRAAIRAAGVRGANGVAPELATLVVVLSDALERAIEAAHPARYLTAVREERERLRPLFIDGAGSPDDRRELRRRLEDAAVRYAASSRPDEVRRVFTRVAALTLIDLEELDAITAPEPDAEAAPPPPDPSPHAHEP